jgi:hypothetical protein
MNFKQVVLTTILATLCGMAAPSPAIAGPCAKDNVVYMDLARHFWKEYVAYTEQHDAALEKAALDNLEHQLRLAMNDGITHCQAPLQAQFYLSSFHLYAAHSFDRSVAAMESQFHAVDQAAAIDAAQTNALVKTAYVLHDVLRQAKRQGADRLFPDDYQAARAESKKTYNSAGLPFEAP